MWGWSSEGHGEGSSGMGTSSEAGSDSTRFTSLKAPSHTEIGGRGAAPSFRSWLQ
jgi:hypothetical protein